jgi:hypothetical protein
MAKEFFKPHFFPAEYGRRAWATNSLNYYLAALFFNAIPLPQARGRAPPDAALHGRAHHDGWSVLIFPEGKRSDSGEIRPLPPRHRDDWRATRRAGRAGQADRARPRASPQRPHGTPGSARVAVRPADPADRR